MASEVQFSDAAFAVRPELCIKESSLRVRALMLALAAAGLVTAAPSAHARPIEKQSSPQTRSALLDDAVKSGVVDAEIVAAARAGRSVDAIVTVQYRDALPGTTGRRASPSQVRSSGRIFGRRKNALLTALGTGVSERRDFDLLPMLVVRVRSEGALRQLVTAPQVVSVQANRESKPLLTQSLALIRHNQGAAYEQTGSGTAVAILDTGVDYLQSEFGCTTPGGACRVAYEHDFAPEDGQRDNGTGKHGTHVAAIAAAVAPGAKILALDVFADRGVAHSAHVIAAINWTIATQSTYGTRAMNLSIGDGAHHTSECGSVYTAPFELARRAGILPVVAAGNSATLSSAYVDGVAFPACTRHAVRVGAVYDQDGVTSGYPWNSGKPDACTDATTVTDQVTCFSQSGTLLSLLAPGAWIGTGTLGNGGTSMAAPHVAGAAAVVAASRTPQPSTLEVERALLNSGPVITDPRNGVGRPRLDLAAAVGNLQEYRPPGDFDDDGKTDPAVYNRSTAALWVHRSGAPSTWLFASAFGGPTNQSELAGDFDGDDVSDLAVYDHTSATWVIQLATDDPSSVGTYSRTSADLGFASTPTNTTPLVGDFDGDGRSDVAIYDRTTATLRVRRSSDDANYQFVTGFGSATNQTERTGDFDGDGYSDFAVYNHTTATWSIQPATSSSYSRSATTHLGFSSTPTNTTPLVGDFDGDGTTDVAIYDRTTATLRVRRSSNGTNYQFVTGFGSATNQTERTGDFDGDGYSDFAVYNHTTATWSIQPATSSSYSRTATDLGFTSTPTNTTPLAGDFDGDDATDVAIYDRTAGTLRVRRSSVAGNTYAFVAGFGGYTTQSERAGDFDGDGRSDLGIYDHASATWSIKLATGSAYARYPADLGFSSTPTNTTPLVGDFDGDGTTDVAIYDRTTATLRVRRSSNGTNYQFVTGFGSATNQTERTGDFDGDGYSDFAVYNHTTATWSIQPATSSSYSRSATTHLGFSSTPTNTTPLAGDFDGDGTTDVAIYDRTTATLRVRRSTNGTNYAFATGFGGYTTQSERTGDYDGDGQSDLAIYNHTTAAWSIRLATGSSMTYTAADFGFATVPSNTVPLS